MPSCWFRICTPRGTSRARCARAGVPALLLPRITTLELWAAAVPLEQPVATRAAREALLYQELEKRGWLASADLWAVSAELAGLFDELTRGSVALPGRLPGSSTASSSAPTARNPAPRSPSRRSSSTSCGTCSRA